MLEKIYKMLDINCDNGLADSMNKKNDDVSATIF